VIGIDRSGVIPDAAWVTRGTEALPALQTLAGAGTLSSTDFAKSIYAADPIKHAIWQAQHQKCCFCEHKYERSFATVEHFRPKTQARNDDGTTDPGYWWLAYRLENLLFCCQICNNFKNDAFPVGAPRLTWPDVPWDAVHDEQPVPLDPTLPADDPEAHLTFVQDGAGWQITHTSPRGRWMIRTLNLDREDLTKNRQDHLEILTWVVDGLAAGDLDVAMATKLAAKLAGPSMPYALLARCYFRQHGLWP
jgi:uncharacterized protein (TIGR02646 family)